MRRSAAALLFGILGVVSLAAPASAGGSTDIVIGHPDGSFVVRTVPTATTAYAIASAQRQPGVAWAEVDAPMHASAAVTPTDPDYPQQWGPGRVRAPEAWGRSTGSSSVTVAVVDTGVDPTQPDLAGAVLPGMDFIQDGRTGDPSGHGTGVAGVIAARGNNGQGVAGYCWACKILPVRSLDAKGSGSSSTVADGINWAADHGARIINLSLAGDQSSVTLEVAIAQARAKGILIVAAAGNQTKQIQDLTLPQYPAASPGVIGVVGTQADDSPYSWTYRGAWADVAAPGCVHTTGLNATYIDECGTSFSSPAVAGILGLALSLAPKAPVDAVEAALYATSAPLGSGIAARGRVDAAALLDNLAAAYPTVVAAERVAGVNRIATAVALSKRSHLSAGTVILARADSYADALAAAPLAGRLAAPILLTGSTALDPSVAAEITRLGATTVWLIGGNVALAPAIDTSLKAIGVTNVPRLAGASRYDTASLIAHELGASSAYIVQAGGWPDAVAVSGLAALTQLPILLVDQNGVPAATAQALALMHPKALTVIGGSGVVSNATFLALATATGASLSRIAGASRYETSKLIAGLDAVAGADSSRTWVATGADWPDALAAGPAASAQGGVLLLVDGKSVTGTPTAAAWLKGVVGGLQELVVLGGEASVSTGAVAALTAATTG